MTIQYTEDKLEECLHALQPDAGSIQTRLENAGEIFTRLQPEDFPVGLIDRYVYIKTSLTQAGQTADGKTGSIKNTTRQMTDEFAEELVEDIIDLYEDVGDVRFREVGLT